MEFLLEASNKLLGNNKTAPRKSRKLNEKESMEIIGITHNIACNKSTIMDNLADFGDGPKYNPYDMLTIPVGAFGGLSRLQDDFSKSESGVSNPAPNSPKGTSLKRNKNSFTTTVGLWIFNKLFIEPISDILGYINKPVTGGVLKDINKKMSYALLDDKITVRQLKNYIENSQIVMSCCSALASSHTEEMFTMQEQILKKKQELLSNPEIRNKLSDGDLTTMKEVENTLITTAKDILKDNQCLDMFESGARSNYDNNFKTMYLMRSGMKGTDGSYHVATTSYIDGIDPEQFTEIADAGVLGSYSRSCLTASGGYNETLFKLCVAHLSVGPKGSDCGTKRYIIVNLDKNNKDDWMYSYIIDSSGKLIELTPDIIDKYLNHTVHMRFSSLCESKGNTICEHCAGTLFRRIGLYNIGIAGSIPMSAIKNHAMKAMHSSNVNLSNMDPVKAFDLV